MSRFPASLKITLHVLTKLTKRKSALFAQTDLRDIDTEVKEMNKSASALYVVLIHIFFPSVSSFRIISWYLLSVN